LATCDNFLIQIAKHVKNKRERCEVEKTEKGNKEGEARKTQKK
jgi:hypothetical protein